MAEPGRRGGDRRRPDPQDRSGSDHVVAVDEDFAELRAIIVGPEQRELLELQAHLFDPDVRTRDVSRVLPEALALRANDPQLTRALTPSVEEAITASVRRNPRPLADALFPVIGPAIRKAIVHTLASMMESLNRTVEHSLSWRAVQWRWTALRTGKPFAEIVLLNTLQFRVEQVFLVHRETGLLLQHVSSDPGAGQGADQISAMLTAIQDFVRDSFQAGGGESLDALRVGDLAVIIEQGPYAILAGVIRGTAPDTLRTMFQDALETVHLQLGPELQAFTGDSAPFERARPNLEACLVTEFHRPPRTTSYRPWVIAGALILVAGGVWAFQGMRERQQWNDYLERLRAEPGIVVIASGRRGGQFFIAGLRDPLATDPGALAASVGLSPQAIDNRWEPYQALHPALVTERARDLLRPPPDVSLAYRDGLLTASGSAPARWIVDSERLAPAIGGVRRFEYTGTPPEERLKEQLEALTILFRRGQAHMVPGQDETLRRIRDLLRDLDETARIRGRRARVDVIGHTDEDGTEATNARLSQNRADTARDLIGPSRFESLEFTTRGVGSVSPATRGGTEQEKQRNRRASFSVLLSDRPVDRSIRP
jgi:OOP family OmpA-OmpF porin